MKKIKAKKNYSLPSVDGVDVIKLLNNIKIEKNETIKKELVNKPPAFTLEIGVPANNIEKQLKKQKIEFDPSCIKKYDKLIKGIVGLKNEEFISEKKKAKLISAIYKRSIKHVYFIYEMV
jgi:hypothetical protein